MAIEVFNRFEHKYIIDRETYEMIQRVMDEHMELDGYNPDHRPYTISNIYYDTGDDLLIRRSLSKPAYKEKLRLRAYGVPELDTKVFLEIKKKCGGIVNKRRTRLALGEAYGFVETGRTPEPKPYMNEQVLREISYFLKLYNVYPRLYLAYDRVAYFEVGNPDLRISFDFNIRSRRYDLRLEDGDHGEALLPPERCLMEIKTSLAKPLWLANMLTELGARRTSFSKYGEEYRKTLLAVG